MILKFKTIVLVGLILCAYSVFAQSKEEAPPISHHLSLNIGAWGYYTFSDLEETEKKRNIKPLVALTYNNTYEIGISYLSTSTQDEPLRVKADIDLQKNRSFLAYYAKYYTGPNKEWSFQIGYNRLNFDYENYDYITDLYVLSGTTNTYITDNRLRKFDLYTNQKWLSLSIGYAFNVTKNLYIEPQIAFHSIEQEYTEYQKIINNVYDLSAYPENDYIVDPNPKIKSFDRFQLNVMATYRFTVLKKHKTPSEEDH